MKTKEPKKLYLTIGTNFPGDSTLLVSGTNLSALKEDLKDENFVWDSYDFVTILGPLPIVEERKNDRWSAVRRTSSRRRKP